MITLSCDGTLTRTYGANKPADFAKPPSANDRLLDEVALCREWAREVSPIHRLERAYAGAILLQSDWGRPSAASEGGDAR